MAIYGYASVSTDGQTLDAQQTALRRAGATRIFSEKETGTKTDRIGLAEFERHLILSRTGEGRERAKARGVKFGRKPKLTKHQRDQALTRREAGELLTEIAKTYNVSHMTISRL